MFVPPAIDADELEKLAKKLSSPPVISVCARPTSHAESLYKKAVSPYYLESMFPPMN